MATTKITSPDLFNLESLDTALKLPSGSTAERPTSPSTGEWRYNTTTNLVEFWDGGAWRDLQSENIPPINSENFNTVLYTGNGTSQSITGVGFKPDWIWIKERTSTSNNVTFDSTRGIYKQLYITTDAESNNTATVSSFDSDGFSVGNGLAVNESGQDYVAWCWKANGGTTSSNTDGDITSTVQVNNKAGFSIVQYVGNGTNGQSVGHGLGTTPALIINKATTWQNAWGVWHQSIPGNATIYLQDNSTPGAVQLGTPNSTTFQTTHVGTYTVGTYINYCFKEVPGFSKFSSYTGNGSTNGPIVETGFEPAFVMVKNITSSGQDWRILDNKRNASNPRNCYLSANNSNAEECQYAQLDFLSNGFQVIGTDGSLNQNGSTMIYIAFASDPSTAPVLADSFANKLYTGTGSPQSISGLGFSPSLVWLKERGQAANHRWLDTIRGATNAISSSLTNAQFTDSTGLTSFNTDGFTLGANVDYNNNGGTFVAWNWKANPVPTINTDGTIQSIVSANQAAGISIIQYTGTGANATIGHGLSAAPELVIVKKTSGVQNWMVGATVVGWTKYLELNTTNAAATASTPWNDTAPTTTTVSLGSSNNGNQSGQTYIMYAFHSVAGFSDIGFWQGGTTTITTGFQPSFVIQQDYGLGGGWGIFDSARSGQVLNANTNAAESSSSFVTFTATGFTVPSETSSVFRLYMAFKENPTPYPLAGNMSFLVVAGGGGGARYGAGGAGGYRNSYANEPSGGNSSSEADISLSAGTYTITIGAGGNGGNRSAGSAGVNSTLSTIIANGGGEGIRWPNNTAQSTQNGGSGGGQDADNSGTNSPGTTVTTNDGKTQGTNGGPLGYGSGSTYYGSGGGGAGFAGGSATQGAGNPGAGGNGLSSSITGTSITRGGGGGGANGAQASPKGVGGSGGGGEGTAWNGGETANGTNGTANTGGGGGAGMSGGSGVVVLRLLTSEYSSSTTGSPTVTTDGDYTVLTYTGSGTYVHS